MSQLFFGDGSWAREGERMKVMAFHHSNHTIATATLAFAYHPEDGTKLTTPCKEFTCKPNCALSLCLSLFLTIIFPTEDDKGDDD